MVTPTLNPVKEFWIYTGLRLLLFAASFGIVVGLWFLVSDEVPILAASSSRCSSAASAPTSSSASRASGSRGACRPAPRG